MAKSQQRISKGYYQYSQADNFVTVKNYIFVHEEDQKGLLLRFVNDLGYTVDSMEYTVVQLDVNGNVIDKTKVKHTKMKLLPCEMFVTETAITVDGRCCDFRIVFSCVRSGAYAYTVREGRVVVDYVLPQSPLLPKRRGRIKGAKSFRVKRRKAASKRLLTVLSPFVALVLTLLFILMYMTFNYAKGHYDVRKQQENEAASATYTVGCDWDFEA
jgi:hypothetical protein